MAIDTLKVARRLREAGFSEPQAEAVVAAVQEGSEGADFTTKADLTLLRSELREMEQRIIARIGGELTALRTEIGAEITPLRTEIGTIKTSIEAAKAEMLGRMMTMILSAVLVNIVAMAGLFFAFAKLPGH